MTSSDGLGPAVGIEQVETSRALDGATVRTDSEITLNPPVAAPGVTRSFALRFAALYFLLYAPVVFSSLGFLGLPVRVYDWIWQLPVNALAGLLGLPVTSVTPPAMTRDAFQLAQVLLFGGIAGVGAAVWAARGPTIDDRKLHHWLRLGLRYLLAYGVIHYGIIALLRFQFTAMNPELLVTPVGQWEPREMLWTFFGWSWIFTIVLAGVELLAAALFLRRETTLAGALLIGMVLSNVVILNFFFDVPGKSLSPHLALMVGLLVLPDAKRLLSMHVLDGEVSSADLGRDVALPDAFSRHRTLWKAAVILLFVASPVFAVVQARGFIFFPRSHALAGLYAVEEFEWDGQILPQIVGDSIPWRRAVISEDARIFHLQRSDNRWMAFALAIDEETDRLRLTDGTPSEWRRRVVVAGSGGPSGTLSYEFGDGARLELTGGLAGHRLRVTLKRVDIKEYPFFGD